MPKIKADSVAEHVAQQQEAVFRAAIALFTARGYDNVSLADIAAAVGLARNSLYRYFPSKTDILLRWSAQELAEQIERSRDLLSAPGDPAERIRRWALAQLDYAKTPAHELIVVVTSRLSELDEQARTALADSHRQLRQPLHSALRAAGVTKPADRAVVVELLGGLINAAARYEAATTRSGAAVRAQLIKAIDALIGG